jgi:Zn-dependent peptidase ImmA (M78 family)
MLLWAREEAGFTVEEVATKMKKTADTVAAWEHGSARPTLRQVEQLAKIYHRPYSVFTLKGPPDVKPLAREYRRLLNVAPGREAPELRVALREMIARRDISLELFDLVGTPIEPFTPAVSLAENPVDAARRIRSLLEITAVEQFAWRDDSSAWKAWRNAVENLGILVFVFPNVDVEEVRGVSVFHKSIPVIGINNKDTVASRPFTLVHELVHLLLANASEESTALEETKSPSEWSRLERFAERVSGLVLMPEELLAADPTVTAHQGPQWSIEEVRRIARRFKVTPLAAATGLLQSRLISPALYDEWKSAWYEHLKTIPATKRSAPVTQAVQALGRNGYTFSRLVIDALNMEQITPVQASRYLNLRYPHVDELRLHFSYGRPLPPLKKQVA